MTCHVALVGADGAVMFSDSQGSTDRDEAHGYQKQLFGPDFLIGGTGHGDIIGSLFEDLAAAVRAKKIQAAGLSAYLVDWLNTTLTPAGRSQVGFLAVVDGSPQRVLEFIPGLFARPRERGYVGTVGSGAEFVGRAFRFDSNRGTLGEGTTLADTFAFGARLIDAANESLTVDDQLMAGILVGGKTYPLGHPDINVRYLPKNLNWPVVGKHFTDIMAAAKALEAEKKNARVTLSGMLDGTRPRPQALQELDAAATATDQQRQVLGGMLKSYCAVYDAVP